MYKFLRNMKMTVVSLIDRLNLIHLFKSNNNDHINGHYSCMLQMNKLDRKYVL